MCRFLLVKSINKPVEKELFIQFARMCEKSRAPDGDLQADGWGMAYKDQKWVVYKSLHPIWKDTESFQNFPRTHILAVHARSAGFSDQKGVPQYNQPYVTDDMCFVFNGMIRGVKLDLKLSGKIGSQKIFSLVRKLSKTNAMETVLKKIDTLILRSAQRIEGMNIGVIQNGKLNVLCRYGTNQNYFSIRYYQDSEIKIICSQPVGNYRFKTMKNGEVMCL